MTRTNRQAALACLAAALLAQLLLPAMHAMVHSREQHGRERHGDRERAWIITHAGGLAVAQRSAHGHGDAPLHSHQADAPGVHGAPDTDDAPDTQDAHDDSRGAHDDPAPLHRHHHDGDQPGDRHGASSLEHLTAFFLEATPPALAIPYRRVAAAAVPLVDGRRVISPIDRAQPVRGPPQQS